jgi:hypothetical protein
MKQHHWIVIIQTTFTIVLLTGNGQGSFIYSSKKGLECGRNVKIILFYYTINRLQWVLGSFAGDRVAGVWN